MFDSHCHLDFPELASSLASELASARERGIEGWLVPGCEPEQWTRLETLRAEPGVHVAVGLHPWWTSEVAARAPHALDDAALALASAAKRLGAVAIGECGLDAVRSPRTSKDFALQTAAFEAQLLAARELELPIVLHVVRAHREALAALRHLGVPAPGGVVHGFSGSKELAGEYLALGLHLGIGCQVTSPRNHKLRETTASVPLERLLVETDAPDQWPHPAGKARRGKPLDLARVVDCVAELRHASADAVGRATAQNARTLFAC